MRWLIATLPALALGPLLAACGSNEPPGVDFERPVGTVYGALATVDGQVDMQGLLNPPTVVRRQVASDELVFLLGPDTAEHRGQVTFRFHDSGEGHSRVTVDAEIPKIEASFAGETRILSEARIERVLAEQLGKLSRRMSDGGLPVAEIDALDQAIAFTALALDPTQVKRALEFAADSSALSAAMEQELAWHRDSASESDSADSAMDDAAGDDASGLEAVGSDALGEDPAPDADWGAPGEY